MARSRIWRMPPRSAAPARTSAPCASTFRACSWSFASISTGRRSPPGASGCSSASARRAMASPGLFERGRPARAYGQRPFVRDGKLRTLPALLRQVDADARSAAGGRPPPSASGGRRSSDHDHAHEFLGSNQEGDEQDAGPLRNASRAATARRGPGLRDGQAADGRAMAGRRSSASARSSSASRESSTGWRDWTRCPGRSNALPRRARRRVCCRGNPGALGLDLRKSLGPEDTRSPSLRMEILTFLRAASPGCRGPRGDRRHRRGLGPRRDGHACPRLGPGTTALDLALAGDPRGCLRSRLPARVAGAGGHQLERSMPIRRGACRVPSSTSSRGHRAPPTSS